MMLLTTARLLLRNLVDQDLADICAFDADPEVQRYRGAKLPTEEETRAFLHRMQQADKQQPQTLYPFAIVLQADQHVIGVAELASANDNLDAAELGYRLHRRYWNQGYTTEVASALLSFGFTQLRLHRIFALCHPDNIGSRRVMEKIGMQYEGCLRENYFEAGAWRDSLLYAIIEHEWDQV